MDSKGQADTVENMTKKFEMEREIQAGEKSDLLRKLKESHRKLEELTDDVRILEDQNLHLKGDKSKIMGENDGVRRQYRDELGKKEGPDSEAGSQKQRAREEYLRSYMTREGELDQILKEKDKHIEQLYKDLRALKVYAKQLKYLAEDSHPIGQPLPDILQ